MGPENEDGKKDLLVGSGDGVLRVYLNQGSDSSPLWASPVPLELKGEALHVENFAAPFVADWNGDGKKDLLVGNGNGDVREVE